MKTLFLDTGLPGTDALADAVHRHTFEYLRTAGEITHVFSDDETLLRVLHAEKADVIVTFHTIPKQTALMLAGMDMVLITIGFNDALDNIMDLCIDPLRVVPTTYFTGIQYLLPSCLESLGADRLASRYGIAKEEFVERVRTNAAEEMLRDLPILCTKLDWDSVFFGLNVGYVQCRRLTPRIEEKIRGFLKAERMDFVEYLCDSQDRKSMLTAEHSGYSLVDIRVTFGIDLQKLRTDTGKSGNMLRRAVPEDIPQLRSIAHDAYRDSRYYADGNFLKEKLVEFYENWIEKAVLGTFDDYAYVLNDNDRITGFCTIKKEKEFFARLSLVGVESRMRGKGVGMQMIPAVLEDLRKNGIRYVSTVTQGRNYAAQRLYQKCGFLTAKMELWYHKWM